MFLPLAGRYISEKYAFSRWIETFSQLSNLNCTLYWFVGVCDVNYEILIHLYVVCECIEVYLCRLKQASLAYMVVYLVTIVLLYSYVIQLSFIVERDMLSSKSLFSV